jgi:hypothetical protein
MENKTAEPTTETTVAALKKKLEGLRWQVDSMGGAARLAHRMKIQDVERELRKHAAATAS